MRPLSAYQKKRFMINRVLIRLKVVQIVYAYYKNSGKSLRAAEDEMFFSLSKAYDLYHYLLLLMPGITNYAADRISFLSRKVRPTESDKNPNLKFVNNRFIAQLEQVEQLVKFAEKSKLNWVDHSDFLRRLLDKIEASDMYKEYMESGIDSYDEDKELWRKLYKAFVFENEELDEIIEEQSLYWNDDKAIVDTFVLKTIKRFEPENGAEQELMPEYKDDEDKSAKRFEEIVQGIRNAAYLGAPMIVVHPCTHLDYSVEGNPEILFEYNLNFYKKLIPVARECGIKIAIENIGRISVTSTPERLNKLFDTLCDPVFTVCVDVGHCLLQGVDPAEAIRAIGPRLVDGCTHVHDNNGERDSHTLP